MATSHTPFFKIGTTAVLVGLIGFIVLLFLADIAYVNIETMRQVLASRDIRAAFFLSLMTSVAATFLCVLVAIPSAYALSRFPFRGSVILDIIVDLLIVLPVLVIGVSLLVFFRVGSDLGTSPVWFLSLIGKMIAKAGEFFIYTRPGIILAQFCCAVSFAVRTIKAAFDSIDPRTEQVALTLGCTQAGAFRRITLPLAKHGIIAGAVLSWARAFGIFGPIAIVAGAVRRKTEVLPTSIYLEISIGRLEIALGISLLMIAVAFFILVAMRLCVGSNIFGFGERA